MIRRIFLGTFLGLGLVVTPVHAASPSIGVFTGIYGAVSVTHAGTEEPLPASVKDGVHFQDLIETQAASRMRALLDDDTLLSLAEDSRLEITEHIYDPEAGNRIAILNLLRGTVRALVSKMPGAGSKFEIRTDSAIAAARGTYFVVWVHEDGNTGIANIGDEGDVAFTAAGQEVIVRPGQYSVTLKAGPPIPPLLIPPQGKPARAIQMTEVRQNIAGQTPKQMVDTTGGVLEQALPPPRFLRDAGRDSSIQQEGYTPPAVVSGAGGSLGSNATPPAVISGGVSASGFSNSGLGSINSGLGSLNSGPGSLNSGPGSINSGYGSPNSGPGSLNSGPGSYGSGSYGSGSYGSRSGSNSGPK